MLLQRPQRFSVVSVNLSKVQVLDMKRKRGILSCKPPRQERDQEHGHRRDDDAKRYRNDKECEQGRVPITGGDCVKEILDAIGLPAEAIQNNESRREIG